MELEAALKASMEQWEQENKNEESSSGMVGQVMNGGQQQAEEPKFQAFAGQGHSLGGAAPS